MDASRKIEDKKADSFEKFEEIDLSFVPPKVNIEEDLKSNKKLLEEDEIKQVEAKLKNENNARFSKKELNTKYGIIKMDGELYAVYKGIKAGKHLGKGGQGKVKLVQNLGTGSWHALKIREELQDKKSEELNQAMFISEHQKLASLGKAKQTMIARKKENKPTKYQIILDYVPGKNLIDFLNHQDTKVTRLPSIRWIEMTLQMLQEVKDLHQKGFLHRDIKLDNFMYDIIKNKLTLIDLGLAVQKDKENKVETDLLVGTPSYHSPDLLRAGQKYVYRESTDVFALGCAIRELLGFYVENVPGNAYNSTIFTRDDSIRDFLDLMKHDKPYKRPSIDEAIKFFTEVKKNLMPMAFSTVGIVNLSEYKNETDLSNFINALKYVDKVILIDDKAKSKNEDLLLNAQIIRSLTENGITVQDKVIIAPNIEQQISHLPAYLEREEKKGENEVVNYLYFSPLSVIKNQQALVENGIQKISVSHANVDQYKSEISLSFPVSSSHFNFAIEALEVELKRLTDKYKLSQKKDIKLDTDDVVSIAMRRANAIRETHNKLTERRNSNPMRFTYDYLYKELDSLQAQMLSTRQYSRHFSSFFEKKVQGKESISNIKSEIQSRRKY